MVSTADPLAVYRIAERIRECVADRLLDTPEGAPNRSCVIAGSIAWDDCECGQLVVSIQDQWFSSNFPGRGNAAPAPPGNGRCGPPILVVQYGISILRCAPSGGEGPEPPTCAELDTAAQSAVYDAWAVRWGAHCCLREWQRTNDPETSITDFVFAGQPMVGPAGMCQGSELTVLVGIVNACPPCDPES